MFDDDCKENNKHVERAISTKTEVLEGRVLSLLSVCATETWVKDESDALKVLLAGSRRDSGRSKWRLSMRSTSRRF